MVRGYAWVSAGPGNGSKEFDLICEHNGQNWHLSTCPLLARKPERMLLRRAGMELLAATENERLDQK